MCETIYSRVKGYSVWFTAGATQDLGVLSFDSAEAFEAWLAENHACSRGIWLDLCKKGPGIAEPPVL